MSADETPKSLTEREEPTAPRGLGAQVKLILRLIRDPRVSPLLKLLPVGSILYLLFPDLVVGPLDDAAVIGLGMYTFVELCPSEIVAEHRAALAAEASKGTQS